MKCSSGHHKSRLEHAAGGGRRGGGRAARRCELLAGRQGGDGQHDVELLLSRRLHRASSAGDGSASTRCVAEVRSALRRLGGMPNLPP